LSSPLDLRRTVGAWSTVALFGLTFMSAPLMIVEPKSLPDEEATSIAYTPDSGHFTKESSLHIY